MKPWYRSKTIIIARLMMILSIIQQFAVQIIPGEYVGYVLFTAAILMEVMRWVTTSPVGTSKDNSFTGGNV